MSDEFMYKNREKFLPDTTPKQSAPREIHYRGPGDHSVKELEEIAALYIEKIINFAAAADKAVRERDELKERYHELLASLPKAKALLDECERALQELVSQLMRSQFDKSKVFGGLVEFANEALNKLKSRKG